MKQITRRALVQMAASALLLAQASACGSSKVELGDDEIRDGLTRLARDLFPHDSVPDTKYSMIAEQFINRDQQLAALIVRGLGNGQSFATMADRVRMERIRDQITTPAMLAFRMTALISLYHDLSVTSAFGYQGPSFEDYGYIERGFNDLDWLPEPPVGDPEGWGAA